MTDTPTPPQPGVTQEQIRVAAQVGVELLTSETTVIPTLKMEAGIVLRAVLNAVAQGNAVIVNAAKPEPEAPPAPDAPKTPKKAGHKKAPPRKRALKSVESQE